MGSCFGGVRLGAGDGIGGDHAVERGVALAGGGLHRVEGIEGIRPADDAGEQGGLREREFGRVFFEIDAGGLADALDLAAPVDLVDVGLEDLVLFRARLRGGRRWRFRATCGRAGAAMSPRFSPRLSWKMSETSCWVMVEAPSRLPWSVFGDGADDADGIEGAVVVKPLVLAGEDGLAEIFGNLAQRDDRAFFAVDAADFLAQPVADDRALGHGVDFREIVVLGAEAVDDGEKQPARRARRRSDSRRARASNFSGRPSGRVSRLNR